MTMGDSTINENLQITDIELEIEVTINGRTLRRDTQMELQQIGTQGSHVPHDPIWMVDGSAEPSSSRSDFMLLCRLVFPVYLPSLCDSFAQAILISVLPVYASTELETEGAIVGTVIAAQWVGAMCTHPVSGMVVTRIGELSGSTYLLSLPRTISDSVDATRSSSSICMRLTQ